MNVLFQIRPDNATSKYKLILLYTYHSQCFETYTIIIGRTDSHSHHTRLTPSTTTTVLAVIRLLTFLRPISHHKASTHCGTQKHKGWKFSNAVQKNFCAQFNSVHAWSGKKFAAIFALGLKGQGVPSRVGSV